MVVCGIEMKASEARLCVLDGTKANHAHIDVKPRKLTLRDDDDATEVRAFRDALYAFLRENGVELLAIKKRGRSGEYAGGAIGFKLEAVAQLYDQCEVTLTSPQTVAAAIRNNPVEKPDGMPKYQEAAFHTAFSALP